MPLWDQSSTRAKSRSAGSIVVSCRSEAAPRKRLINFSALGCNRASKAISEKGLAVAKEPDGPLSPRAYLSGLRRPTEIVNQNIDAD
jgi:hypothetical protein